MTLHRRALLAAPLLAGPALARAEEAWPARPLRLVIPFTPAGTTDLLVSYTYRIAFEDSGQNFGLAAAISTLIFFLVAAISLVNMRLTRMNKA